MRWSRNHTVFAACAVLVLAMVGASYAAVPLYYLFCQATGYGGTPNRAAAAPGATGEGVITVAFDTNVDAKLPWVFEPEQRSVEVRLGEQRLVYFRATNTSDKPIIGHATFNVVPDDAARYFSKIQCFCFSEQRLNAGQSVEMPVVFFVAPEIASDRSTRTIRQITLSYTFYPAARQTTTIKTAPAAG